MSWAECTEPQGKTVYVNLADARTMRRDDASEQTMIFFDAQAGVAVRETPEEIFGLIAKRNAMLMRATPDRLR